MFGHQRPIADLTVWLSAGLAALTPGTVIMYGAGILSIVLALIRIFDRIKYGPRVDD